MEMKCRAFICSILILIMILVCGCTSSNQNALPSNKFVAVYVEMRDNGAIVSGTYPYPGMAMPIYPYALPANFTLPANDSLKILLVVENRTESSVRLTGNSKEAKVRDLPYSISPEITIVDIDKNGTMDMLFSNQSINISSGASWTSPITSVWNETNTIAGYDGTNYTYTLQFKRTWMIQNMGVFNKK